MLIDAAQIEQLIPHSGAMSLLAGVERWDETQIACIAHSHTAHDNPLRSDDQLSALHAIEYGAQAMATHGGLLKQAQRATLHNGYLAGARDWSFAVPRLDTLTTPLRIVATRLLAQGSSFIYEVEIHANELLVASGRATVMALEESV